jgi:hypothetical protein
MQCGPNVAQPRFEIKKSNKINGLDGAQRETRILKQLPLAQADAPKP